MQFLYQFGPGDRPDLASNPDVWTEDDERIGAEHYQRLKRATDEGIVILAGRSAAGEGPAVVIFEADSEKEASQFMEDYPFVAGGLFTATLHPFRASLVRGQDDSITDG